MRTNRLQNLGLLAFLGIKILPQNYLSFHKRTLIIDPCQLCSRAVMA